MTFDAESGHKQKKRASELTRIAAIVVSNSGRRKPLV